MAVTAPLRRAAARQREGVPAAGSGLREVALFALAYVVYFGVRALTEGSATEAGDNAMALIRLERQLGIAWEGTLQEVVVGNGVLVGAANAVYMYGHWPAIIAVGVLLFRYRRRHYFRLRDAFLLSGAIGLVVFGLFPVAPPRLTDLPIVDTVTLHDAGYRQIVPASLVNEYAAMPSFHAGWNLLAGIVVFGAVRHWLLRALAVLGPASMMVAVVVTANHFVVDVIAGIAIALACLLVRDLLHRRRGGRPRIDRGERRRHAQGPGRPHSVPGRPPRRERSHPAATGAGARRSADRG